MGTKFVIRLASIAALAAVTVSGQASTAGAAEPATASVQVAKNLYIQADGAGLVATVKVKCERYADASLTIEVTQATGESPVTAKDDVNLRCTGDVQTIVLGLAAYDPDSSGPATPLAPGPAFATAAIDACSLDGCEDVSFSGTVQLSTKAVSRPTYKDDQIAFKLPKSARIEASGAGALVSVNYTCDPGVNGFFWGTLSQRTGRGVSTGSDRVDLTCSDTNRAGVLTFHATSSGWSDGSAFLAMDGAMWQDGPWVLYPHTFRTLQLS